MAVVTITLTDYEAPDGLEGLDVHVEPVFDPRDAQTLAQKATVSIAQFLAAGADRIVEREEAPNAD